MERIEIQLTPQEILQGAFVGIMRQVQNLKNKNKPAYGAGKKKDWQLHIEGALGEMALGRHLNLFWSKGVLRGDDVGIMQVRTRSRHSYDLIIHDRDKDDKKFWLLTGLNGCYWVRGWIMGADAKNQKYWLDPAGGRPAYFVPAGELNAP